MKNYRNKKYTMALFIMISLLAHLSVFYVLALSRTITFSTPVPPLPAIIVTLKSTSSPPHQQTKTAQNADSISETPQGTRLTPLKESPKDITKTKEASSLPTADIPAQDPINATLQSKDEQNTSEIPGKAQQFANPDKGGKKSPTDDSVPVAFDYKRYKGPVRKAGEFLATKKETLTYRISLLKIPVGTAIMEATSKDGELQISVKITSNAVFSTIYPVDDLVETRMIKGNYLLTRVRQNEGSYKGDFGFTLMLREHKAFWVDRLANRYNYEPLPVDDVMDALSGFYFLRNQDLEVGKSVLLHLYDSNEYTPTNVEVLRREHMNLPGVGEVNTLVLHPLFQTAGFFRRTGDIMIWLTDDKFRVPVRLETFITLGKVTAELIAAESEQEENLKEKELPGESFEKPAS